MSRIIFEYSPIYVLLCLAVGIGVAYVLYSTSHSWGKWVNRSMFAFRAALITAMLLLLLGPILKQTENIFEKPVYAFLVDNSISVKESADTTSLISNLRQAEGNLKNSQRQVEWGGLNGPADTIRFKNYTSDLATALRETVNRYEGKNLEGIVLVSDGIYNNGLSPLYLPLRIPVFTVGVGDTTERSDVVLKNVAYNRIVYQGNKFPVRAEVAVTGLKEKEISVSILSQGKVLQQQKKSSGTKSLLDFDFQLDAPTQGMQRLEVRVENLAGESNIKNNRSSIFIEVVEGKKKILLAAPAPHPDIKAIRNVLEKNSNYEVLIHLPGVKEADPAYLIPGKVDLLVAVQGPDTEGKITGLISSFLKAKSSMLVLIGQKTALRALPSIGVPATFEPSSQRDEVQPVLNPLFQDLGFSGDLNTRITRYPPVSVPFGKFSFPVTAKVILQQRIGSVITDRPLLYTVENDQQKVGILTGEGIWKWRLNEFQETEKTTAFDELFSKLLQYLSTRDDRRKFRSFPLQHEFTSDGPVVMESQVYNDLFEPVFGNTIDLEVRDEQGKTNTFRYTTNPGNSRYRIGGLKEGVYRYKASTDIKGKREEARGEFLVIEQNQEAQNLTADFGLLRKLSESTGGRFFRLNEVDQLAGILSSRDVKRLIHSEESFQPLINLKVVFLLLLLLVSAEWFMRKFYGSY